MRIFLIYCVLFTFYCDEVLGGLGFAQFRGLSVFNLNIYLLLVLWSYDLFTRRKIFTPINLNKYIALLGYIILSSIIVKLFRAEIPNISIKTEVMTFKQWLDPVILFIILFNIIDDKETCKKMLLGLCILLIAFIITQLLAIYGISDYQAEKVIKDGRIGSFGAAGTYSITLVLLTPFVLSGGSIVKNNKKIKICCIILIPLIFLGLVGAGSRNGVISLIISIIVYMTLLKRNKVIGVHMIMILFSIIISVCILAYFLTPENTAVKVSERFNPYNSENIKNFSSGRTEVWANGWKLFKERPIIGHGQKSFAILSQLRGYPKAVAPHNEYLKHLVEYGIIGFIAYCSIFIIIIKNTLVAINKTLEPFGKLLYISYLAGLCGYMIGIFFTNDGPSSYIFWIYTAIICKYSRLDSSNEEKSVFDNNYSKKTIYNT